MERLPIIATYLINEGEDMLFVPPRIEEMAKGIKEEIEDWLEKNKGSKGYEIPRGTNFEYIR